MAIEASIYGCAVDCRGRVCCCQFARSGGDLPSQTLDQHGVPQTEPTVIFEDNKCCVAWSEGSVGGSERAKHIDLRKHFVHDAVQAKILKLQKIDSKYNAADLLTKALDQDLVATHRKHCMGL